MLSLTVQLRDCEPTHHIYPPFCVPIYTPLLLFSITCHYYVSKGIMSYLGIVCVCRKGDEVGGSMPLRMACNLANSSVALNTINKRYVTLLYQRDRSGTIFNCNLFQIKRMKQFYTPINTTANLIFGTK